MLEGRPGDRGTVIASPLRFLHLVVLDQRIHYWPDGSDSLTTESMFTQVQYVWERVSFFGALIPLWVPDHLMGDEAKRNVWVMHRIVDPAILRGFGDVAEIPQEWQSDRTQYAKSDRLDTPKGIENHV